VKWFSSPGVRALIASPAAIIVATGRRTRNGRCGAWVRSCAERSERTRYVPVYLAVTPMLIVSAEALQRGEVLPQARGGQLVDAFRRADVLQPVDPQVPHRRPLRQRPCLLERHLRQHHLAAVRGRGDPRGPVQIHPDMTVLIPGHLPGMQAHPGPDRIPARPVMGGQGALRGQTARHCVGGGPERHEEAVSFGGYLMAVPGPERRAQQNAVIRQRFPVPVTETT